jgi:hypothetical protein
MAEQTLDNCAALAPRVADVYANSPPQQRLRLLNRLLGTVGPLALVTIAAGAFASLLPRRRWQQGVRATLDDAQHVSAAQVLDLATYVEQKCPEVISQLPELSSDGHGKH